MGWLAVIACVLRVLLVATSLAPLGSLAHTQCRVDLPLDGWTEGCPHIHDPGEIIDGGKQIIKNLNDVGALIDEGYLNFEENVHDVAKYFGVTDERVERAIELRRKSLLSRQLVNDWISNPWVIIRIRNQTDEKLTVAVRFLDMSDNWTTKNYEFAPFESAVINARTQNRYAIFSATSSTGKWAEKQADMGDPFGTFTYSFDP